MKNASTNNNTSMKSVILHLINVGDLTPRVTLLNFEFDLLK